MRTTLNIPDSILKQARLRAVEEGKTLTDLLVEGLKIRLARSLPGKRLPASSEDGGLRPGVEWGSLQSDDPEAEMHH